VSKSRTVSLVTLGCARNEVDSEELAARLSAGGWALRGEGEDADVVLVNTCGFIEAAKQESIDELLAAADSGARVAAVGCLAERYGNDLAEELPEAQVLSFDDYSDIAARLDDVLAGRKRQAHVARDRRTLLPVSPVSRQEARAAHGTATAGAEPVVDLSDLPPGIAPASGPPVVRRRLSGGVTAPLKIASGCDRRCSFCAIPSFRGSFVSRRPHELLAEAGWLAGQGVRELVLVSENSTSYGKDLGDLRLLETVLPELAKTDKIDWVRVSYLQPAEVRPGLIDVMTSTPGVVPYFDLSFQHASGPVLRRMRRFGDRARFIDLIERIRQLSWTRSGSSATPTRTAPRRPASVTTASLKRARWPGGSASSPGSPKRSWPSERPTGWARRSRCSSRQCWLSHAQARAGTRAAPRTRRRMWTARRRCSPAVRSPLVTWSAPR
jgi:tRNA A37 methylthiotransferase MiaB